MKQSTENNDNKLIFKLSNQLDKIQFNSNKNKSIKTELQKSLNNFLDYP